MYRILLTLLLLTLPLSSWATTPLLSSKGEKATERQAMEVMDAASYSSSGDGRPAKQYGIGLEVHTNYVPDWFLHMAMRGSHDVTGSGFGARLLMRSGDVDIAIKGMYWKINAPNAVWLGINHEWTEAEYTEFEDFGLAYLELSATWNTPIMGDLYLIYGAGIGGGIILGDIYTTPAYGCTGDNFDQVNTVGSTCSYLPGDTRREKEDLPPGMGMIEVFAGVRYDITKNVTVKGELGVFLPGFLRGTLALEFLF